MHIVTEIRSLVGKGTSNDEMFREKGCSSYVFHHIKSRFQSRYESDSFVGSNIQK